MARREVRISEPAGTRRARGLRKATSRRRRSGDRATPARECDNPVRPALHRDGAAARWRAAEPSARLTPGCEKERDMLNHHDDRPPGALAHGATKPSDIERVRGDIARAQQRVARGLKAASTHDG